MWTMRVILRDPPLAVLMIAIVFNLPLKRVASGEKPAGWMSRKLARFIEWRDQLTRKAS